MKRKGSNFDLFNERVPRQFGGMLLKGNAKVARPLSTKHAIHLVLKSQLAVGARSFLRGKNVDRIDAIIRRTAEAKGIKIYHFVNVGNHLHLVLKLDRSTALAGRRAFHTFVRSITGIIARHVLGAERNRAKGIKFWQARPFTRLVNWGRDYNFVSRYMAKNSDQAKARRAMVDWGFGVTDPAKIAHLDTC
jgi:REP element-mobilizing transposase RayT